MLCATVAEQEIERAIKVGRKARRWSNMLELRLDYLNEPDRFPELLERLPGPFVITCRPAKEKGKFTGSEQKRIQLLSRAARRGVDYIDVERHVPEPERKKIGGTQILSYHNYEQTPDDLKDILESMQQEDADYIKLATCCNNVEDALRLMDLKPGGTKPIIAIGMGEYGRMTRILYRKTHSLITFGSANPETPGAPGQLSVEELSRIYRIQNVDQSTDVYALIGDPVSHSKSPRLFNALFDEHNLNAIYLPIRMLHTDSLPLLINQLELKGASVTIPHKRAVIPYLDSLNPYADDISAVNTIARIDNRLEGYNTDAQAAIEAIVSNWPEESVTLDTENPLDGKDVLLLGAGGAARAAVAALQNAGASVTLSNRTKKRAEDLGKDMNVPVVDWENRTELDPPDLLVNATSAGMKPLQDVTPFPAEALDSRTVVFDMVYTPPETKLLREAADKGCHVIPGTDMFTRQALRQFRLWTGIHVNRDELASEF